MSLRERARDKPGQEWLTMTSQERPAGRGQRKDDVLRELRADGALTAAELVERTSLSRPTIISLLRELEEDGWVSSEVGGHGAPGRPATAWAPASRAGIVIGADVLVDSMLTVVSTFHGRVLEVRTDQLVDRCREARLDVVAGVIGEARDRWSEGFGLLRQVAVSTTGVVDGHGTVLRSDLVPQWEGLDLAAALVQRLGVSVSVENDINMAAWGEFCCRRGQSLSSDGDMLLVQMTKGLHTGLVLSGRIHRGRQWNAGEISDVLDLRLEDGQHPDDEWIDRAALTIGSVAGVVDPDLIVVAGPTSRSLDVIPGHCASASTSGTRFRPGTGRGRCPGPCCLRRRSRRRRTRSCVRGVPWCRATAPGGFTGCRANPPRGRERSSQRYGDNKRQANYRGPESRRGGSRGAFSTRPECRAGG